MTKSNLSTKFASAERAKPEVIEKRMREIISNNVFVNLLNSLSQMVVILNLERQIIYSNKRFLELLQVKDQKEVLGKRPGEAVSCIHANVEKGGCGTSDFCSNCGAIQSILEAQAGSQSTKECRILTTNTAALDLEVTSTPIDLEGYTYTVFTIIDKADEKRRQTLERVFFHDVLNSAGGISSLSELLPEIDSPEEIADISQIINRSANNLVEEILLQRQLSAAERGDLQINVNEIWAPKIIKDIKELYINHEITKDKNIMIDSSAEEISFNSDKVLLRRILSNMLKNALEASLPVQTISINCKAINDKTRFAVHNSTFMPKEVQQQLFQRSFSTKGLGRGIGTYSMKLLGEKYLKGKVWFESTIEKGTTFYLELPDL